MGTIFLVRHGESTWNETGRYQGRIDTELSIRGQEQVALIAQRLRTVPVTAVYASPLRRALHTAINVALPQGLEVQVEPDLTEIDHGLWCGLLKEEVEKRFGPLLEMWYRAPAQVQMPGGESLEVVRQRAMSVLARIQSQYPQEGTVICSHDAVIRVILLSVLGMDLNQFWSLSLENASLSVLSFGAEGTRLLAFNDTCHLGQHRSSAMDQAL
ncbi:MAG: histidine phosphatase family protein [Chloroflexi bacterium]|nr:histidine phosphatase family protein [Chloroflexota bacterium]